MLITILDVDKSRIGLISKNLDLALCELGMKATVVVNNEPPYLAREGVLHKVPVLEIADKHWSIPEQRAFTKEECINLLKRFV